MYACVCVDMCINGYKQSWLISPLQKCWFFSIWNLMNLKISTLNSILFNYQSFYIACLILIYFFLFISNLIYILLIGFVMQIAYRWILMLFLWNLSLCLLLYCFIDVSFILIIVYIFYLSQFFSLLSPFSDFSWTYGIH